jgi:RHS repeat-associated protein
MRTLVRLFAFMSLCAAICVAQDEVPTRITNQNRIGDLPYSTSIGTEIEHVDMATGALNVNIPIWSIPGRADASLALHWSSNYWVAASRTDSVGNSLFVYSIAADSGWQSNHPFMTQGQLAGTCDESVPSNLPPRNVFWTTHFMYHDEQGGQHLLALQKGGGLCGASGLDTTHPDISASGMQASTGSFGVTLADGTHVGASGGAGQNPLFAYVGGYKDANGNTHATNVDSLGRTLFTVVDGPRDANQNFTQTTFTVNDANGHPQNIVVNWQSLPMTTNFQTLGVLEDSFIWCAIQSIILPNGTSYQFHYEPDYGELTEIDLPTGGVIKYQWANYTYPNPANEIPDQESRRYVASRTEIVNGVSNTWTFQLTNLPNLQIDQSTVTFPPTLTSSGTMVQNQSVLISQLGNLVDFKVYSGAASGSPLREYSMTYDSDEDPTLGDGCAQNDTSFPTPMASRLTRLITILDNGAASKKEFDYDRFLYYFYPNHCPLKSQNIAVPFLTSRGNVVAIREYGFGTVTGNPGDINRDVTGASLLRTTTRTYQHDADPNYATANIVDKVLSQKVFDNVANVQASQAQYDYDKTAIIDTPNLASVPGHDSTFTSAVTVRGNPTHVSRWNNVDGSFVTATYNYDDLGNLRSITDPRGNTTSWVYDDSFDSATNTCAPTANSFSYVSKKIDAANHNFFVTRRACTGQVHSHQDDNDVANGIATLYAYDLMGRVLSKTLPNGGTIVNDYHNDPVPPLITTTTTATPDPSIVEDQHLDGLKRVIQTVLYAPECGVIVDTSYDALGRVSTVSNPHCPTALPTDGTTSTVYDALSRPVIIKKQDSSIVGTSYVGTKTTVTDETGREKSSFTDALGRLIEVDEEATHQIPAQPASLATSGNGSVTISGTEQSQQVQTVPATPGSASFSFSGAAKTTQVPDCPLHQSCPIYDSGEVDITVNGVVAGASYSHTQNPTSAGIAQALVNQINTKAGMPVTATLSGTTGIVITSPNGTNYAFSLSQSYDTADFTSPSFTITPSSGTMSGGQAAQFGTSYDSGATSVVLNGTNYSANWGQGATASSIASDLAARMNGTLVTATANPCVPVTAQCGAIISLQANAAGASTNYTLTASSSSTLGSFAAAASGASLTGGADAVPATPAQTVWSGVWVTQYKYDALGNLYCVEQHGDAAGTPCPTVPFSPTAAPIPPDANNSWRLRRFGYNSLGQLLWASNPESGVINYAYDPNGNLAVKTSPAANQTVSATTAISYCYDSLNRLLAKGYSSSTPQQCSTTKPYLPSPAVVNNYDESANGIGYLTSLTDQAGSGVYTYDAMGQIKTEQRTIGSATKSMSYDYNLHGGVTGVHYPSGAVVTYTNQSAGRPTSAIDTVNSINYVTGTTGPGSYAKYGPDGSIASLTNGFKAGFAGITSAFFNNLRLQPCRISAGTGTLPLNCTDASHGNIFDIGYDFHLGNADNGNVLAINNFKDATRNQSFVYDSVNRLTSAQNAGTDCSVLVLQNKTKFWGNTYSYDEWGNLLQKNISKCGAENFGVTTSAHNQIHASGTDYQYDAAGNMTFDATAGLNYSFDQENRLTGASGFTYTYDSDGNRVKKANSSTGMLYWYMTPGIVGESDLSGNLTSEYVFFDGERVARTDFPSNVVSYYFSDHLQTASVVTDSLGNIKSESDYYPWGGELQFTNNDSNHFKFTGKERDSETGLDYFGARYYSNGLGRFVTPDWSATSVPVPYADLTDPQSLNQYSYVRNIPTSKVDTDGHCPDGCPNPADAPKTLAALDQQNQANADFGAGVLKGLVNLSTSAMNAFITMGESTSGPIPQFQPSNDTQAAGMIAGTVVGVATSAGTEAPVASTIEQNAAKGAASESRVLNSIGETKNTQAVTASEGKSIPDFQNSKVVGEIKDTKTVSNTRQLRIQKEAAQESGRDHNLITGTKTHVTDNAAQGTEVIRRDDLGPK